MGGNEVSLNVAKILKKQFKVILIFKRKKKNFLNFEQKIIAVDNYTEYKKLFKNIKPSFVINMYSVFSNNINLIYNINIKLSLFLINFFSGTKTKLILIGSAAEYGTTLHKQKFKESDNLNPVNLYGLSKSIQSTVLLRYAKIISTKTMVLRIFNIYGNINAKHLLIGKLNNKIKKNVKTFKLGSLNDYRDYLSSEKTAKMITKCLINGKYYSVYNIGSGKLIKVRDLIKKYFNKINLKNFKIIEKQTYRKPNYSYANIEKYKKIR